MTPLATAIAVAVADAPRRRVPLTTLLAAAAAVDRTGAVSVGWRSRIADAVGELADAGIIEVPRTRWDSTAEPPLPAYVTRPAVPGASSTDARAVVWHAELGWAAALDAAGKLTDTERRFLTSVNAWLPRRPDTIVPQRERSLDICGDEKVLDTWVFTPLFAPGRLTYERLRCKPCWPPVHQEILGPGAWLVIENWTTCRTLADAGRRHGWEGRLICVCHTAGTIRSTANRAAEELQRWTRDWLGGTLGRVAGEIIADGGRIVQETVGVELLNTIDAAQLLEG